MPLASFCDILGAVEGPNPLVIALFLFIFGAGFILGLISLLRRKATVRKPAAEPTCGKCSYIVKGLTTFSCPECGSDLREVGIISASPTAQTSSGNPFLRWSLWAAPICLAMFGLTFVEHKDPGPGLPRAVYRPPLLILSLLNLLAG